MSTWLPQPVTRQLRLCSEPSVDVTDLIGVSPSSARHAGRPAANRSLPRLSLRSLAGRPARAIGLPRAASTFPPPASIDARSRRTSVAPLGRPETLCARLEAELTPAYPRRLLSAVVLRPGER